MALRMVRTPGISAKMRANARNLCIVSTEVLTSHTNKWMHDKSKKSPMELINGVPPIRVEAKNPLSHPIEFICLDLDTPAVCKYCGLRYVQDHGGHHH